MDWKQSISILFTGEVSPGTPSVGQSPPNYCRFTPQEESGADGAAFFYPRASRCPQGLPGEDPRTPSVGFASEGWNQSFPNHLIIKQLE